MEDGKKVSAEEGGEVKAGMEPHAEQLAQGGGS